jgi:hypothetical protein
MSETPRRQIVIEPDGLADIGFPDPREPGRVVTVTCDLVQLAEAFDLIDQTYPIVEGDPEATSRRRDAMNACVQQLLDSPENPLPPLTHASVYRLRLEAYKHLKAITEEVKKKVGLPEDGTP